MIDGVWEQRATNHLGVIGVVFFHQLGYVQLVAVVVEEMPLKLSAWGNGINPFT